MPRTGRPPVERVTLTCSGCGERFERRVSEIGRTDRPFCSVACAAAAGRKPRRGAERVCEHCGTRMYSQPKENRRFCSHRCHSEWQARNATIFSCETCGKTVRLSPSSTRQRLGGRFCSQTCMGDANIARPLDRMHNGRVARLDRQGYVLVWEPEHPKAMRGWVFEHRWIVEQEIGRYLERREHVHHVNGVKDDNRSENLVVIGHSDHSRLTAKERGDQLAVMKAELAEYRARFGPLNPE